MASIERTVNGYTVRRQVKESKVQRFSMTTRCR